MLNKLKDTAKKTLGAKGYSQIVSFVKKEKSGFDFSAFTKCFLELPIPGDDPDSTLSLVQGWICSSEEIEDVSIVDSSKKYKKKLKKIVREDVVAAYSGCHVFGFRDFFLPDVEDATSPWFISYKTLGAEHKKEIPVEDPIYSKNAFINSKKAKLNTLKKIFDYQGFTYNLETNNLIGSESGIDISFSDTTLNVLTPGQKPLDPGSQQFTSYDARSIELINRNKNGLVLDFGSGVRRQFFDNVISLDILDSFTIDVVNYGKVLPFKSNSFDGVISLSVLEHLQNPFHWAKEIVRILKPGGELYFTVPFLAPFHGYPDHYYNMTLNGLRRIFGDEINIIEDGVYDYGQPIWALNWFLDSYIKGLPSELAENFKNMKVSDFLGDPMSFMDKDFVTNLKEDTKIELSCVNFINARKK